MAPALLEITGIHKRFPGVKALDGVQLEVLRGEVHALLGENGAGKSTVLKTLAGAQAPDEGVMKFDGQVLGYQDTPVRRQQLGIVTIYQEFNLLPHMSVAENMYLGREPLTAGLINWPRMFAEARAVIDDLGLGLDPKVEVRSLSVAQQQMVEIAKALTLNAKLIIMDEPTAALSGREVAKLHDIVRGLRDKGISIIYVTHRLKEVKEICDRYTVFRDGRFIASGNVAEIDVKGMVRLMVGRDVEVLKRDCGSAPSGEPLLRVSGVSRAGNPGDPHATVLKKMTVEVHAGEVLGFAGLVGAGRTELARIIFGADRCDEGVIWLDGGEISPLRSPTEALKAGIALVPEDRKQQGCFLTQSIRQNMTLPCLGKLSKWKFFVDERAETALVEDFRAKLRIKMPNDKVAIGTLSGGNQQKVLLARCMALQPKVLIVDEPTRGIDVGAKAEVHQVLFDMAEQGVAVIVISSELPEVMAISDRIVTFREGRITGVLSGAEATEETLMGLMAQGDQESELAAA